MARSLFGVTSPLEVLRRLLEEGALPEEAARDILAHPAAALVLLHIFHTRSFERPPALGVDLILELRENGWDLASVTGLVGPSDPGTDG